MSNSTLTSKGQTTIPREVREALGMRPGMRLIFEVSGATAVIRTHPGAMSAFGALKASSASAESADFRTVREAAQEVWAKETAGEGRE